MTAIFEYAHVVEPREIDPQGHVSNTQYVCWMQQAAIAHSAHQGWSKERYQQSGFGWVVHTHHIRYQRAARLGDAVVVRTWVANMRRVRSLRRYDIVRARDQALLARAQTDWVLVRTSNGKPMRIPPELVDSFEIVDR